MSYIDYPARLEEYPLSRLFFITIRDPKGTSRFDTISKVRTWVRRYSNCYMIVRSPSGGLHYHVLAGIEPHKKICPIKGIHFHFFSLDNDQPEYHPPDATIAKEDRRCKYVAEQIVWNKFKCLCPEISQTIIYDISTMVKNYWEKQRRKSKRGALKAKVAAKLTNVCNYLNQNLMENEMQERYFDYYISQ